MTIEHYPYRFVKKDIEPWDGPQGFLLHRLLYSFKSSKTHQTYWVWIELYKLHFYAVINRKQLAAQPKLLDEIVDGFKELYPYFE